jgi:hypothetical protein
MAKYDSFRHKNKRVLLPENKIRSWVEHNFDYKERKNGEWLLICSPFTDDADYKMGINVKTGIVNYWPGNEWAGPVNPKTGKRNRSFLNFVKIFLNCTFAQAVTAVAGKDATWVQEDHAAEQSYKTLDIQLPPTARPLTAAEDRITAGLLKWLLSRGYTNEEVIENRLHYTPSLDVIWPYFEYEELVYWQSRSRVNKKFNFPSTHEYDAQGNIVAKSEHSKGDFLYGFDDIEPASFLIVTEAIFDKHTIGNQTVATGGAILTPNQLQKIKLLGPQKGVILAPDNDKAGMSSVISNAELLTKKGFKVYYSVPPKLEYSDDPSGDIKTTKDWNELFTKIKLSKKEIRNILDNNIKPVNAKTVIGIRSSVLGQTKKVWRQ